MSITLAAKLFLTPENIYNGWICKKEKVHQKALTHLRNDFSVEQTKILADTAQAISADPAVDTYSELLAIFEKTEIKIRTRLASVSAFLIGIYKSFRNQSPLYTSLGKNALFDRNTIKEIFKFLPKESNSQKMNNSKNKFYSGLAEDLPEASQPLLV